MKLWQSCAVIEADKNINVKVSMGIEQFMDNQTIDEVINNADKYLYQAKNAGRNQIFPKF